MKKSLVLSLALSLLLLSACGPDTAVNDETSGESETSSKITDAAVTQGTYTVTLEGGETFELGGSIGDVTSLYGEPVNVMEAPNCIREGNDTVYVFDAYSIMTSPSADGGYFLAEFTLLSDGAAFDGGVTIGSTADEVDAAFGTQYEENFGVRTYSLEGASISVVFADDTVSAITISSTVE